MRGGEWDLGRERADEKCHPGPSPAVMLPNNLWHWRSATPVRPSHPKAACSCAHPSSPAWKDVGKVKLGVGGGMGAQPQKAGPHRRGVEERGEQIPGTSTSVRKGDLSGEHAHPLSADVTKASASAPPITLALGNARRTQRHATHTSFNSGLGTEKLVTNTTRSCARAHARHLVGHGPGGTCLRAPELCHIAGWPHPRKIKSPTPQSGCPDTAGGCWREGGGG